jgi:DNA replication protein DnaC
LGSEIQITFQKSRLVQISKMSSAARRRLRRAPTPLTRPGFTRVVSSIGEVGWQPAGVHGHRFINWTGIRDEEKEREEKKEEVAPSRAFLNLPSYLETAASIFRLRRPIPLERRGRRGLVGAEPLFERLTSITRSMSKRLRRAGRRAGARSVRDRVRVEFVLQLLLPDGSTKTTALDYGRHRLNTLYNMRLDEDRLAEMIAIISGTVVTSSGYMFEIGSRVIGVGVRITELRWSMRARCNSSRMRSRTVADFPLRAPRSREGLCGLAAICFLVKKDKPMWAILRASGKSVYFKRVASLLAYIASNAVLAATLSLFLADNTRGLSESELATTLEQFNIALTVNSDETLHEGRAPLSVFDVGEAIGRLTLVLHEEHYWAALPKKLRKAKKQPTCSKCKRPRTKGHKCVERAPYSEEMKEEKALSPIEAIAEAILSGSYAERDDAEVVALRASIAEGKNCLFLGEAGTGKTTAVRAFLRDQMESGTLTADQIALMSYQGVATTQYAELQRDFGLQARTIHSTLGKSTNSRAQKSSRAKAIQRMQKVKLIIIDEIASCSLALFEEIRGMAEASAEATEVFGGIQVLLVGDFGQTRGFGATSQAVIDLESWHNLKLSVFTLKQQRRMGDLSGPNKDFLRARLEVYRGLITKRSLRVLNSNPIADDARLSESSHLAGTNKEVFILNQRCIGEFMEVFTFMPLHAKKPEVLLKKPLYTDHTPDVQRSFDLPLKIAVGAKVMFTDNFYLAEFAAANGTVATVLSVEHPTGFTVQIGDGPAFQVKRRTLAAFGRSRYFSVKLGFARTGYKCQGATMDRLTMWPPARAAGASDEGLMSMCITRCRDIGNFFVGGRKIEKRHFTFSKRLIGYMHNCGLEREEVHARAKIQTLPHSDGGSDPIKRIMKKRRLGLNEKKKTMHFYPRGTPEGERESGPKHSTFKMFHKLITYDYETGAEEWDENWRRREKPYGVFANYWEDEKATEYKDGVTDHGLAEGDMNLRFCTWVMGICMREVAARTRVGKKADKRPIVMAAYNGSGFDHVLFVEKMINSGMLTKEWKFDFGAIKGAGRIVSASLSYQFPGEKGPSTILQLWDPCLWLASPLSEAFDNFATDKAKEEVKSKDCFPHDYVTRVGAKTALLPGPKSIWLGEFPGGHRKVAQARLEEGTLEVGHAPGYVMFDCHAEYRDYVKKDVVCLEYVMESMQSLVWDSILPGENLPITRINTAASFSQYAFFCLCEEKYMVTSLKDIVALGGTKKDKKQMRLCNMYRPSIPRSRWIRRGIFGGCCSVRRKGYECDLSVGEEKEEEKGEDDRPVPGQKTWAELGDECPCYVDANGLYHYCLMHKDYPYGEALVLTREKHGPLIDKFMEQFQKSTTNKKLKKKLPMFMAELDVYPETSDVEPFVPHREKKKGALLWDVTPKLGGVYTCEDLRRVVALGGTVENVTELVIWGEMLGEVGIKWKANKGRMFEKSGAMSKELRLRAKREGKPGLKVFGKLIINALYGSFTQKDEQALYQMLHSDDPDSLADAAISAAAGEEKLLLVARRVYPIGEENRNVLRDADGNLTDLRPLWIFSKYTRELGEDDLAAKAPQIGAFCLAYSRAVMSKAVSMMMGEKRFMRESLTRYGIFYSDTDSFFVSYALARHLPLDWAKLGDFGDDLDSCWQKGKALEMMDRTIGFAIERNANGDPLIAKIVDATFAAKKVYGGKCMCPYTSKVYDMKTKAKGVPTSGGLIIYGDEWDRIMHDLLDEARASLRVESDRAREAENKEPLPFIPNYVVEARARQLKLRKLTQLRAERGGSDLTVEMMKNSGKRRGMVVARSALQRGGLVPTSGSVRISCGSGEEAFTFQEATSATQGVSELHRVELARRILAIGSVFGADRIPLPEDPNLSMPRGWKENRPQLPNGRKRRRRI